MPQFERVVIIGVGLLGGSIGKALRERKLVGQVVGCGRNLARLQVALECGAVDAISEQLPEAVSKADVVVSCLPVQKIADSLSSCLATLPEDAILTDVGSTKASIVDALTALEPNRFCGSHPLAGSDKSGVEFASADLLNGKLTVVTPTELTPTTTLARTLEFWELLGSSTLQLSPAEHDEAIARTSHLPHILAAALAAHTPQELLPLVASGWKDTTRVASGSVEMWLQILLENKQPISDTLQNFRGTLESWLQALAQDDLEQLRSLLETGKNTRDSVGN